MEFNLANIIFYSSNFGNMSLKKHIIYKKLPLIDLPALLIGSSSGLRGISGLGAIYLNFRYESLLHIFSQSV